MRTITCIVALAAGGSLAASAQAGRIVDSFDHTPQSILELWVGQPPLGAPATGTARWRGRVDNVLGGFREAELEHVASDPGRWILVTEGITPGSLVYDGQPGSGAIMRLEYSTGGSHAMDLSAAADRYLEIDVLYADKGGVRASVELVGGETSNLSRTTSLFTEQMTTGAQTLRFDLGASGFLSLGATDKMRVSFDAGGVHDVDFAIGEIRLVPAPATAVLGCAGVCAMVPARRRRG